MGSLVQASCILCIANWSAADTKFALVAPATGCVFILVSYQRLGITGW